MKNLLLSNIILLFFSACSIAHYGSLAKIKDADNTPPSSLFGENFNSYLFKTNIRVYGRDFSGLLITKQLEPNDYRVIFTTELGMKLFDFEFKDTAFTLHYCVPQFNRPKLLSTIQQDISILLMNDLKGKSILSLIGKNSFYKIKRIDTGKYSNYYFFEKDSNRLIKIEHSKRFTKKIVFMLTEYQENFPNTIIIKHSNIRLKIELKRLRKQ